MQREREYTLNLAQRALTKLAESYENQTCYFSTTAIRSEATGLQVDEDESVQRKDLVSLMRLNEDLTTLVEQGKAVKIIGISKGSGSDFYRPKN